MEQIKKFVTEYTRQLPGWDEFDKTENGHIVVEARNAEEAERVANERLGKYCVVTLVKEQVKP